jgi:hypothetical protein
MSSYQLVHMALSSSESMQHGTVVGLGGSSLPRGGHRLGAYSATAPQRKQLHCGSLLPPSPPRCQRTCLCLGSALLKTRLAFCISSASCCASLISLNSLRAHSTAQHSTRSTTPAGRLGAVLVVYSSASKPHSPAHVSQCSHPVQPMPVRALTVKHCTLKPMPASAFTHPPS